MRIHKYPSLMLAILLTSWNLPMLAQEHKAGHAQSKSTPATPQSSTSLGDTLRSLAGKEMHIFYIHGIGSDGPKDRDSQALRKSLCDYLKDCIVPGGTQIGTLDYAGQDEFQIDAPVPKLGFDERRTARRAQGDTQAHFACGLFR